MFDLLHSDQRNAEEKHDEWRPRCICSNSRNPYQTCSSLCHEVYGRNKHCAAKRHDQKRPRAPIRVAQYGPVPGYDQSTPRAELYAIYAAVKNGVSPQRIICDHINYVNAMSRWMGEGRTTFLNPKTPNLDLRRRIYDEVRKRGGLCDRGNKQLSFVWQPSHTRAHEGETAEQKHLRRGNDAADFYANRGWEMHNDISEVRSRLKACYDVAIHWARWLGHASLLQYSKGMDGCDHDLRPKIAMAKAKNLRQDVKLPVEAKVIRKMPWARSSVGTIEYLDDLWQQDDISSDKLDSTESEVVHQVRKHGTISERAYVDKFHHNVNGNGKRHTGPRFVPRTCVLEMNDNLPTEAAMGHMMMTAGLKPRQFFWCELCSSYHGQRVRKLMPQCDRLKRKVPAVEALRRGFHPIEGTLLLTQPRRLCKRDVGTHSWSGEGRPDDNLVMCQNCDTRLDQELIVCGSDELAMVFPHAEEEDPLGLGLDLG